MAHSLLVLAIAVCLLVGTLVFHPSEKNHQQTCLLVGWKLPGEGILELIGTYTCVPGSWQLKILEWAVLRNLLSEEVTSLVPLVLLG